MLIRRFPFFDPVVCDHIQSFYEFEDFVDGSKSGTDDRSVKRNYEMKLCEPLVSFFFDQFYKNPLSRTMLIKRGTYPMFLKYVSSEEGHYGFHNDAPCMGKDGLRSDYVIIVGLNDESEYEGGDLIIRYGTENCMFRLQKGQAIFFDPNYWHSVTPVTKGERRVAVMWVETLVQDAFIREVLYDYSDLVYLMHKSIDMDKWKENSDIEFMTYCNYFRNKIMRQYANYTVQRSSDDELGRFVPPINRYDKNWDRAFPDYELPERLKENNEVQESG